MGHSVTLVLALSAILLGAPLLGLALDGQAVSPYLSMPPSSLTAQHASFSWVAFVFLSALIIACLVPLLERIFTSRPGPAPRRTSRERFPWWGWLGYVLAVNAFTWQRAGQCMLTHRTRHLLALFPLSALFWWYFEYLNRFVQNWYYGG